MIASHVNLHPTLFLQKLTHIINTSTTCTFQLHTEVNIVIFHFIFICKGIAQQPGTRKIAHLFAFHLPPATWFSKMRMSVKVKYGFVLHTGIAGSRFYFRIIISYLKRSGMTGMHVHHGYEWTRKFKTHLTSPCIHVLQNLCPQ